MTKCTSVKWFFGGEGSFFLCSPQKFPCLKLLLINRFNEPSLATIRIPSNSIKLFPRSLRYFSSVCNATSTSLASWANPRAFELERKTYHGTACRFRDTVVSDFGARKKHNLRLLECSLSSGGVVARALPR